MNEQSSLPEDMVYCELHDVRHVPPACDFHQFSRGSGATISGSEGVQYRDPAGTEHRVLNGVALFMGGPIDGERRDCRSARGHWPLSVTVLNRAHADDFVPTSRSYVDYIREEMMVPPGDLIFFYRFRDLPLSEALGRLFEKYPMAGDHPAIEIQRSEIARLASEIKMLEATASSLARLCDELRGEQDKLAQAIQNQRRALAGLGEDEGIDPALYFPKMLPGQSGWESRPFVSIQDLVEDRDAIRRSILDSWWLDKESCQDGAGPVVAGTGLVRADDVVDASGVNVVKTDETMYHVIPKRFDPVGVILPSSDDAPAVEAPKTMLGFTLDKSIYAAPRLRKGKGNMINVTIPLKNGDDESGIVGDQTPRSFSFDEATHRLIYANENAATVDVIIEPIDEPHN